MRIGKYTPKTSGDNGKTLKARRYIKAMDREGIMRKKSKELTKREAIEEGLNDYYKIDQEIKASIDNTRFQADELINEGYIEYDTESKSLLDLVLDNNPNGIKNVNHARFIAKFVADQHISIEGNGKNIDENTKIFVRNEVGNIKGKMSLKDFFTYLPKKFNDYRKSLNYLIDTYDIKELEFNLKDNSIPKYLQGNNNPYYKGRPKKTKIKRSA